MTTSDEQHSQYDEVFTQIQPQITIVTNTNAKFPYLKKAARKLQKISEWKTIKICPRSGCITEEHLAVQRETKARTTLLTALPDDHIRDFYHLDDAKEIWLAIKARALPPSWSQVTLVLKTKGGLEYLSFDDLSNHYPSYSTSSSYFGNREASFSQGSVVDDVIHSFLAESEPKQQLAYEDLKQIEKLDLEELDLKWQMAMLSIRVQKFEKKAGRKIKFNGQEAARFDKKLVQCYKCSQKGHFARECRAKASQDSQRYSAYKTQNAGKKTDDSQALISVDTFINWQDHEDAHADEGALKIYGMIAGMESDPDSERKATSEYALMGFTTDKEVQTCSFECEYKYNELKKLYNEQREEISNSSVELNAYKSGVKTLEAQIRCHQKNQLAYEENIRILKFDLEDKSNLLAYHEKLIANATQEKQALQAKLDNEIANWLQSSKNLVKLIDSLISVKDKVGLGYGSYENELYIDNEPNIFYSRPKDWLGKPLYSWFTKEGDMHGVPPPMTGNYMPTPVHVEIDESQFSYGRKQTNISETSSENVETCESNRDESNEYENNNFDSCGSNFSSILESASETVVESEPNVVMSKVWTDAPIIEEVDSDNEYVVTPGKANEKPSHADNKSAKFINTPRDMGTNMIQKDIWANRMAQEQAMAKQNEKTNGMGNFNRKWDKMTIWENTQRVDPSNKIVPRAVLLQSGIVDLSSTRPNLSTPVPTGRQNLSKPVTTGRRNLPTPVPTGKAVPAGRPNYPIPVTSGRTNNTVRPFPSVFKPNRPNTQSASPIKRPVHRASPPKTFFSYFGGDKVKTAVKSSAGCSWSSSRYVWKKNTKNNGGSYNNNRLKSKDPLGRPKPGNPHKLTEDLGIVDSGCSRSMTGNRHTLENFQEFKGGNVTFGGGEGKITGKGTIRTAKLDFENVLYVKELHNFNLFSVSQICDEKNRVLFTKTECLVLSKDFKLPDESQVLLKVPRKHNLYSFNLEDLAPQGDLACLLAKATLDESTQWHRRLDAFSRLSWVFFLAKKDETVGILKEFIKLIENQLNKKVKVIRCDNETEFKNRNLIEFCGSKGIKRDYSNPRTPQQNGVAERKNRTLIEAARTMLTDSFLLTMFWTEAVATTCYVLNRVLVTNPHNKTPYELLTGIVPTISYLKPFGCHVTILNTIDQLGKFDGKSDEGFLVGYSTQGKAYRVYNLASKRVEETMNVKFIENKPNVAQTDTNDSDTDDDQDVIILPSYPSNATSSPSQMAPQDSSSVKSHSSPVVEGTQAEKEELASLERQEYEANAEAERLGLEFAQAKEDLVFSAAKSFQTPSTNTVTPDTPLTLGTPVTPSSAPFATSTSPDILSASASSLRYPYPSTFANEFATGIPILKDIYDNPGLGMFTSSSYDDEEPRVDLTNMSSTENVTHTSTKRVKSAHPSFLIIGDIASLVQTRRRVNKSSNGESALKCCQALEDPSWVEAMQEEMQQFQFQNVWILLDLPLGKRAIGTKWILKNKKDARGIVIRNKARLVAQGHRKEEGIDHDEVFAPVTRIEAIMLFLAYASFIGFMVYQMDVKSVFLYGKIEEEVYVTQPKEFVDPKLPKKVYKVVKALYGLHQAPRAWYATLSTFLLKNGYMRGTIDKTLFIKKDSKDIILVQVYVDDIIFGSTKKAWCDAFEDLILSEFKMSSMGELTVFLGLQVEQRSDGIFISQDKYVAEILRKFDLESVKTATTPYEPQKPKDKNGPDDDVNVYLYRSMIGSLMYLTASRPDIMFAVSTCSRFQVTPKTSNLLACKKQTIVATSSTEAEYVAAAHCCGQVLKIHTDQNVADLLTKDFDGPRYAISHDPFIYDSLVKQFWRTASLRLAELGPPAIVATIDGAQYTISEASVRSNLQLADDSPYFTVKSWLVLSKRLQIPMIDLSAY
ncbi:putative ribonuclease H-like domain-containing protein [Tanacetum coccineum]